MTYPPTPGRGHIARSPSTPAWGRGRRTPPATGRGRTPGRHQGNRPPPTPGSQNVRPRLEPLFIMRPPAPIASAAQPSPQAQQSTPYSTPESGETGGSGFSPLLSSSPSRTSIHSAPPNQPVGGSNAVSSMEVDKSTHSHRSNRGEVGRSTSGEEKQASIRSSKSSKSKSNSHSDRSHHSNKPKPIQAKPRSEFSDHIRAAIKASLAGLETSQRSNRGFEGPTTVTSAQTS